MEVLLLIMVVCGLAPIAARALPYYLGPPKHGASLKELVKEPTLEEATSFLADNPFSALLVDAEENIFDIIGFDSPPNRKTSLKIAADCREAMQDSGVGQLAWVLVERGFFSEEEMSRHVRSVAQMARLTAIEQQDAGSPTAAEGVPAVPVIGPGHLEGVGTVGVSAPVIHDPNRPPVFGELDAAVSECFEFLESERGSKGPVVRYFRDYFLVYELPGFVSISVGMERSWLVPFIFVQHSVDILGRQELRDVLKSLGIVVDSSGFPLCETIRQKGVGRGMVLHRLKRKQLQSEWPLYLEAYAKALRENFDAVVDHVVLGEAEPEETTA